MNGVNVNLHGYCNKPVSLYNYIRIDMDHYIFRQNCINFTYFSIIHGLIRLLSFNHKLTSKNILAKIMTKHVIVINFITK